MNSEKKPETCGNMELVELSPMEMKIDRLKNHLEKDGVWKTVVKSFLKLHSNHRNSSSPAQTPGNGSSNGEVLNLLPGEHVEIKSADEISKTLDKLGKHRGLSFMPEMWKYCGGRYRVYKRVNQIVIIGTESLKKLKNTVLLEGVNCDGSDHSSCDNSCFHFWREVWLRRAPEQESERTAVETVREIIPGESSQTV